MDILKRNLAPITDAAWEEIRKQAARTLRSSLTARKVVDVAGPKGFDFSAVSLGRLDVPKKEAAEGINYGIRRVLPLIEIRVPFELETWELDNVERGARDIDLEPVIDAADKVAGFEERAVYRGFGAAGIRGIAEAAENARINIGPDAGKYPDAIVKAKMSLQDAEVEGPYALVLGPGPYRALNGNYTGYPPRKNVEQIIGGPILYSAYIEGGFLISTRGGDFELTIGQDLSIGYEAHELKKVRLYLSETFTFRALEPRAAVELPFKA